CREPRRAAWSWWRWRPAGRRSPWSWRPLLLLSGRPVEGLDLRDVDGRRGGAADDAQVAAASAADDGPAGPPLDRGGDGVAPRLAEEVGAVRVLLGLRPGRVVGSAGAAAGQFLAVP